VAKQNFVEVRDAEYVFGMKSENSGNRAGDWYLS
jgi:hypothetical protein